ncbi:hypothetical protein [Chryseobacterium rhizosphaerae]
MKQEIKVPMTNLEIETLLVAGKKISSLGEEFIAFSLRGLFVTK